MFFSLFGKGLISKLEESLYGAIPRRLLYTHHFATKELSKPNGYVSLRAYGILTQANGIKVEFINPDGSKKIIYANEGETLLNLAHENDVELEGACEGSLACSTCHVILDQESYDKLEEPSDEENDMLDLAFGLTETSRLGCQVKMRKELDGIRATIPSATRNMAVDGFKPKPH